MAYSATELLEARVFFENVAAGRIQTNELRRPVIGATKAMLASTPFAVTGGAATIENIKKSDEQSVKLPVQTKMTTDGGTARSCATSTADSDSALITLSWSTLTEGFYMSELLHANNDINFQAALRHKLSEKMNIIMQRYEVIAAAYFEANSSAVNLSTQGSTALSAITNIAVANKNEYFSRLYTGMLQNNFSGPYYHVHSMGLMNQIMLQQNEGSGNSNNLAPQQDGFTHFGTNLVPTTGSTSGTSFTFVPGTVGVVNFNGTLHKQNRVSGQDTWTTIANPFAPELGFDLKIKEACTDNSGVVSTRGADLTTKFELVLEYANFKAYTSNTDTGIYKSQLSTS